MTERTSTAERVTQAVKTFRPPWFVRLFGAAIVAWDIWKWTDEAMPTSWFEIVKHCILLLIGLLMFYPEVVFWLYSVARRTRWLDRRSGTR